MEKEIEYGKENLSREEDQKKLIEEATNLPGIIEVMKVFQNWQEADMNLEAYRLATDETMLESTTNHANNALFFKSQ